MGNILVGENSWEKDMREKKKVEKRLRPQKIRRFSTISVQSTAGRRDSAPEINRVPSPSLELGYSPSKSYYDGFRDFNLEG